MNIQENFKKQIEGGATEMFFYGVETLAEKVENSRIDIKSHKGTLETFPTNLEFVRMMSESTPLFKLVEEVLPE